MKEYNENNTQKWKSECCTENRTNTKVSALEPVYKTKPV